MKYRNRNPLGRRRPARAALATLIVSASLLAGCNGSDDEAQGPNPPVGIGLSGSVMDGPVRGATVKVFQVTGGIPGETPIATAVTAADGSYSLELPASAAASTLVVSATGGQYCAGSASAQVGDAASCEEGTLTDMETPLITVTSTGESGDHTAHVTPISTAAALTATSLHVMDSGIVHVLEGSVEAGSFATAYGMLTGGAAPDDSLIDQTSLLAAVVSMQPAADLAACISNIQAGALKGAWATLPQESFSIMQGGTVQDLNGNEDDAGITARGSDPTVLVTADCGAETCARNGTGTSVSSPYFEPRAGIDVETLQAIMEDDSVEDVPPHVTVDVTVGADTYRGYKLADVIVRATKFRPRDGSGLPGAFGVATAVVAFSAESRKAVFSFTELIRSENGEKTIVAFEKNGQPLSSGEGALAVIAGNDYDPWLRKVPRLAQIHIRNDFLPTALTAAAGTPDTVKFSVAGAGIVTPTEVTAAARSTTSDQRSTANEPFYAVDKVGTKSVSEFPTYFFSQYGPRHAQWWYGQGIRLTDVLDTAGLVYPEDKGACFVVVRSAINMPAVFSCGELYNSSVGVGDGLAGSSNRSRRKGVLLVTDDYRTGGGGTAVMMTCWGSIDSCTKTDGENPAAYTSNMDGNNDAMNNSFIALVSTEDVVPFQSIKRWFPVSKNANGTENCGGPNNCIPWIDVGERLQHGIYSMEVFYAAGNGNGTRGVPGAGGGGGGHAH